MSSENDGKLMVNSLNFYYPARVTQKSPRDFCAQVFFIYMHLYKTMRSNNQESRRIPVFPCQIVWPEQFRTRCGTHDGGRGSHLALLFLENANKTSCRFPARDRAGQQDSLVKVHSTCSRLNALRARGVTPRGIFLPPPLSSFSFSLYLPSPIMEIRPPDDTLGLFWDLRLSVASCHQHISLTMSFIPVRTAVVTAGNYHLCLCLVNLLQLMGCAIFSIRLVTSD